MSAQNIVLLLKLFLIFSEAGALPNLRRFFYAMPKRFIQPDWKLLRKLPYDLQRAWFYIWDKADECGVYTYDPDYMKLDLSLNEAIPLHEFSRLPECEILPGERILIKNFLLVNYKNLKPDYNPHKPAFRDLSKNKLILNSSLNQASMKLEEEDIDKDKEEDKEKGGTGENKTSPKEIDVERVFIQQGGSKEMATAFFNRHSATGWKIRGSPIFDWSHLVGNFIINWNENKKNGSKSNSGSNGASANDRQRAANENLLKKLREATGRIATNPET